MILRVVFICLASWILASCSVNFAPYHRGASTEAVQDFADNIADDHPEVQALRERFTDAALSADVDTLMALMHPELAAQVNEADLQPLLDLVNAAPIERVDMITYRVHTHRVGERPPVTTFLLEYVLVREDAPLVLLSIASDRSGEDGAFLYKRLNWQVFETPFWEAPEELGTAQWTILFLAFLSPLLILQSLFKIFSTPRLQGRWGWLLLVLLTAPTYQMIWSTGAWSLIAPNIASAETSAQLKVIHLLIGGISVSKGGDYQSWVITSGFPLGALIFHYWWFSGKLKRKPDEEERLRG